MDLQSKYLQTIKNPVKTATLVIILLFTLYRGYAVERPSWTSNDICRLTTENGLAGESAYKIIKDRYGRMWIATSAGVNLFNGVQIAIVPFGGEEGERPMIYDICESPLSGDIYVSTQQGIGCFNREKFLFEPIASCSSKSALLCDSRHLYVSNTKGFHIYEHGQMRTIDVKGDPNVHCMGFGNDSTLWMLTKDALCHYLTFEEQLERREIISLFPNGTNFGSLVASGETFFIGTKNNGLFVYDYSTNEARQVDGIGNVINSLNIDKNGNVCVATDGMGAFLLDGRTAAVISSFKKDEIGSTGLSTNAVYHYFRDLNGNDWFAMSRYGVTYTYSHFPLFHMYRLGSFTTEQLDVRSLYIDGRTRLIGTLSGLYFINENTGVVKHFTSSELGGGNIVTCIEKLDGKYYIGTYDGGLNILDPATMTITTAKFHDWPLHTSILTLKKSPEGELWVGTDIGLAIIAKDLSTHILDNNNAGLPDCRVTGIEFSVDGKIWINGSNGMWLLSSQERFFTQDYFPDDYFHKELYMASTTAADGQLFFGSKRGVFQTNSSMTNYSRLQLPDGIIDESCKALCIDGEGSLWLASEAGLFKWQHNQPDGIQHFGHSEGLGSILISKDGIKHLNDTLWIATSNGLLWTSTKDLNVWLQSYKSRALLYDMLVGDESIDRERHNDINISNRIPLTWNISSQRLRAKVMINDYAKHEGRFFEYRLDSENHWTLLRHDQEMVLDGLMLGMHKLHVRQAGIAGTDTIYAIQVMPSVMAYVELGLLILAISLLLLWLRYHRNARLMIRERDQMADALLEVEEQNENLLNNHMDESIEDRGKVQKYQLLKISDRECEEIADKLHQYIVQQKAYCNSELKREELANALHITPAKLSYVFSQHLKVNYYDYVNHYRLEEFKRLIEEGEYRCYTIQALSERCGFKKSSFFSTFRKVEGMTPMEYLRKKKVKISM